MMKAFFNAERPLSYSTGTKCKETLSSKKPVLSTVSATGMAGIGPSMLCLERTGELPDKG